MNRFLFSLFFLLLGASSSYSGIPHIVTGRIFNSDASVPVDGSITFNAYITSRPGEVQTQISTGNGYTSGYWYVVAGNFATAWSVDEVLHVDFTNTVTGKQGSIDYTLTSSDPDITPDVTLEGLRVKVKVFLEGPYSGGTMTTILASSHLLPTAQPYTSAPFNYPGNEVAADEAFFISNNVVDWMLVELRLTPEGAAVDRRAALLRNDGMIIDIDGSLGVVFNNVNAGSYYIVIKHRNHLAIMSATAVSLPN
jgi:hypothetical protein